MSGILRHKILPAPGDGIPTYATVADMNAAIAIGDIAECEVALITADGKYYANVDGTARDVCAVEGSQTPTLQTDTETIDPSTLGQSGILCIAPRIPHPWMEDYCGTVPVEDFSSRSSLDDADVLDIAASANRVTSAIGQYSTLANLTGAHRGRYLVKCKGFSGNIDVADYGGSGENVATNYIWNFNIGVTYVDVFRETGSGVNHSASWVVPGRFQVDDYYLVDVRVDASDRAKAYLNGLQLRRFNSLSGTTDEGDGEAGGFSTDGDGSSSDLCHEGLADSDTLRLLFFHLFDASDMDDETAAEYAVGKREWTASELSWLQRDEFATHAIDPDVLVAWEPVATGLQDSSGNGISLDVVDTANSSYLIGDTYWTEAGGNWESSDASLQHTGDLTVQVLFMADSAGLSGYWVTQAASGETSDTNYLYRFGMSSGTNLYYFAEHGGGNNIDVSWTVDSLDKYEIREYRLVRDDAGGGQHNVRAYERKFGETNWTQLTVAGTTGSGVGTTEATVTQCSDGSSTTHEIGTDGGSQKWTMREVVVFGAAKNPTPLA